MIPGIKWKNIFLLVASLIFYSWGEGILVWLMLLSILFNYQIALSFARLDSHMKRKQMLWVGIVFNLSLLGFFKYANFFVENLNWGLAVMNIPTLKWQDVHLPIGISFFTFQALSYLLDVYQKKIPAQNNPLQVGLYIALFPQLIAGPIVRYPQIAKELKNRFVKWQGFAEGMERFIIGLAKKVLIADQLAYVADQVFGLNTNAVGTGLGWLGIICYSFQIYFDFSGYSDMAIGLGRMLGFHFPENFQYPYLAKSIREFWRRWHITLSNWFKDYLYIPLGGNRRSKRRVYFNLLLVFLLCGLWHGASWTFIIWGLFHGFFLVLERTRWGDVLEGLPTVLQRAYVWIVLLISWVFFRSESIEQAIDYVQLLFGGFTSATDAYYPDLFLNMEVLITLIAASILSTPLYVRLKPKLGDLNYVFLLGLFLIAMITVLSSTYSPFIYFRF